MNKLKNFWYWYTNLKKNFKLKLTKNKFQALSDSMDVSCVNNSDNTVNTFNAIDANPGNASNDNSDNVDNVENTW